MTGKTFIILFTSLLALFNTAKAIDDTAKISRLIAYADLNRTDSQSFSDSIHLAIKMAQQLKAKAYESRARIAYGSFYFVKGYYRLSKDQLSAAIPLAKQSKRLDLEAKSSRILGAAYESSEKYDSAVYWLNKAIGIYTKAKDYRGLTEAYNSIAITHQNMLNLSMARFYYKKAIDFAIKSDHHVLRHIIYSNLATIYREELKFDSAIYFFKQAIQFHQERNDSSGLYYSNRNIASVYNDLDSFQAAQYHASKALGYALARKEVFNIFDVSLALAAIYHRANKLNQELEMLKLAGSYSAQVNDLSRMLGYYTQLAEYYSDVGEKDKAIYYYRESLVLADSLSSQQMINKLGEIQAKFGLNEKERELGLRALELELESRQKRISQIIGVSLALVVLILVVYYIRLKIQKIELAKANQLLARQSDELNQLLAQKQRVIEEKNEIVGVIAHDLRSPVTKIQSLLQMLEIVEPKEQTQIFELMQVVSNDALSLIQDLIDLSRIETSSPLELEKRKERFNIVSLLAKLKASAQPLLEVKKTKLNIPPIDEQIELYTNPDFIKRALDNLISNAIKFSPAASSISIHFAVKGAFCSVVITDSGPGFTEDDMQRLFNKFQRLSAQPTGMEQSTGLGLFIAQKLVSFAGGKLSLISKPNEPASFEMLIPLADAAE